MPLLRQLTIVSTAAVLFSAGFGGVALAFDMMAPTGNTTQSCGQTDVPSLSNDPGVCRTDNSSWTYYMDSSGEFELEAPDRTATNNGMTEWDARTDITVGYDTSPTFTGNAETDVVYQEGQVPGLPDNFDGATWCQDKVDGNPWACDQHYVRIRGAGIFEKWLVAHEAGHALGLTHGNQASPTQPNSKVGIMTTGTLPTGLGKNPTDQVDGTY